MSAVRLFNQIIFKPLTGITALLVLLSVQVSYGEDLVKGSFSAAFKSYFSGPSVEGNWTIEQSNGQMVLVTSDDFRAKSGPDVKFFLSPLNASAVNGKNAAKSAVFIGQLEEFEGRLRFMIPKGTNLSDYKSLILHCEEYSKLWGVSPL